MLRHLLLLCRYTVGNLLFAQSIEPLNPDIERKLSWAQEQRAAGEPTVPTTLEAEALHNPFLRVHLRSVQAALGFEPPGEARAYSEADVMKELRARKDRF